MLLFGLIQLVFTLVTLALATATYFSPALATAWQVGHHEAWSGEHWPAGWVVGPIPHPHSHM